MNKGQIGFTTIVVASITGILGIVGVWIQANSKINQEIYGVKQEAAVIRNTEDLHYKELRNLVQTTDKKVDKISDKLDMLIDKK